MATAAKNKAEAPTADYTVTSPLEHDGERYEVGSTVALTAAQAAPLLGHTVKAKSADRAQ